MRIFVLCCTLTAVTAVMGVLWNLSIRERIRLEDLLSELARWYDIEIFYQNPSLKDLHFTASFQRSSNMEEVISLLERTQKIKVNVNGKTLIVQNK